RPGQCRERRRADVGTRGKAERQDDHLAAVSAEFQLRAVRSLQREVRGCPRRAKDTRPETRIVRSTHRSREEKKGEERSGGTIHGLALPSKGDRGGLGAPAETLVYIVLIGDGP